MAKINVLNKHHPQTPEPDGKLNILIMRGTPLGNPFKIGQIVKVEDGCIELTRSDVISEYDIWLEDKIRASDPAVCSALDDIANEIINGNDINLICCCAPQLCHGHTIRRYIENALKGISS
jgi:hypothetical protein